jgi:hypothetical protein
MKTVPAIVKTALKDVLSGKQGTRSPHLSELAQHFTELVGGPRALAKLLRDEFYGAPSGGMVRMRILDIIFRATKIANEKNGPADLGGLSDADLQRELDQVIGDDHGSQS